MFIFRRPISAVVAGLITALIGVLLDQGFTIASAARHAAVGM